MPPHPNTPVVTRNPLVRGYSRAAIGANIRREIHAGREQDQAVAIALSTARRAYRARHPRGRPPAHLRRNPAVPTRNPSGLACPLHGEDVDSHWSNYAEAYLCDELVRGRLCGRRLQPLRTIDELRERGFLPRGSVFRRRRNPTDIEPMPGKPGRWLLRDRESGRIVASNKDQRNAIIYASERDRRERDRARRRRRNPSRGDWIDLLVPLAFLVLLIRGRTIQVGA